MKLEGNEISFWQRCVAENNAKRYSTAAEGVIYADAAVLALRERTKHLKGDENPYRDSKVAL